MKKLGLILISAFFFALTACFSGGNEYKGDTIEISNERWYAIHAAQHASLAAGTPSRRPERMLQIPVNPKRIIVFEHAVLDILLELNLHERVVGIAHMAMPEYLQSAFPTSGATALPDVGDSRPHDPCWDTLTRLGISHENGDLIIMSGRQRSVAADSNFSRLWAIAPTIDLGLRTGGNYFVADFAENLSILGKIFQIEAEIQSRLDLINIKIEQTNSLATYLDNEHNISALIIQLNGGSLALHGAGGRYSLIHRELGVSESVSGIASGNPGSGVNDNPHGTQISPEYIRERNPSIIFWIDRGFAVGEASTSVDVITNHIIFGSIDAIVNNHVFALDSVSWYFVSGGLTSMTIQINQIYDALRTVYLHT
ncbi:MAG: ABC transporter substrate-binding protein [Erysipelotrichales bacterium]|nr:ABC transporter substrate-binding protein [Erysipelotrichales bacterium]